MARLAGEAYRKRTLQLIQIGAGHTQRTDQHPAVRQEFNVVHTPKRGGILILATAGQAQLYALDIKGQLGDLVGAKRQVQGYSEGLDQRHSQG